MQYTLERPAETGALILATLWMWKQKISHLLLFNLDLGSSSLALLRRLEIFFEAHSFFEVGRRIGGVVSWFTYEMENIYTYKY
jgi:hypothetical protein